MPRKSDWKQFQEAERLGCESGHYAIASAQKGSGAVLVAALAQDLLGYAQSKFDAGEYSFAVVLSQAACDLHTEMTLRELLAGRKQEDLSDAILSMTRFINLGADPVRNLYTALTGDDPARSTWWPAWKSARRRRDDVAHRGDLVSAQHAREDLAASASYIHHLATTLRTVAREE